MRSVSYRLALGALGFFVGLVTPTPLSSQSRVQQLLEESKGALDLSQAVRIENLRLAAGLGAFVISDAVVVPGPQAGGEALEFVFVGEARLELDGPNEVESHQLQLFTGSSTIRESASRGVFVVALDGAARAILAQEAAAASSEELGDLEAEWSRWRGSSERKQLNVDGVVVANAFSDSSIEGFFAGWFEGVSLGRLLYVVDPRAPEQVTLGRFESVSISKRERRRAVRQIHREQRRGRLIGVEVDDLGQFDTWLSASLTSGDLVTPGSSGFEPSHYTIDVELSGRRLDLAGVATIELVADAAAGRSVSLNLTGDLRVTEASVRRDEAGEFRPIEFLQGGGEVLLFLDESARAGHRLWVRLEYSGAAIESVSEGTPGLVDTLGWYHARRRCRPRHVRRDDSSSRAVRRSWLPARS